MENIRERIIIVDDIATNLSIAKSALSDSFDVFTAPSGDKLLQLLSRMTPDLILLDIEMPEMDGWEVIRRLKSSGKTRHIPVIFLTGKIDPENEIKGLNLGAVDYITKPFSRELLLKRINFHMLLERQKQELLRHNLSLETEIDNKAKTVTELQSAILKTIAELVECRDGITGNHISRTQYALNLLIASLIENGVYLNKLSSMDIPLLIMSSQLHDVGKISIRDDILMKKGKLTFQEFEKMKLHTTSGAEIIRKIESKTTDNEFLHYAEICAGTHHERWDGTGYPSQLKGEKIPLPGRLMAIVDVYDALVSVRPYKEPMSHEKAVEIIRANLGTQFDPVIGKIFIENNHLFKDMDTEDNTCVHLYGPRHAAILSGNNDSTAGAEYSHVEKIQRYLGILLDAMHKNRLTRSEVADWNNELFLKSVFLQDNGEATAAELFPDESEAELEQIQHHAEVLDSSNQEKWDGTGYPLGLKGPDIPMEGRLMAIVDVYDALTTDRQHRKRKTHREALVLIKNGAGTHFDPNLVELFLKHEMEFENISR